MEILAGLRSLRAIARKRRSRHCSMPPSPGTETMFYGSGRTTFPSYHRIGQRLAPKACRASGTSVTVPESQTSGFTRQKPVPSGSSLARSSGECPLRGISSTATVTDDALVQDLVVREVVKERARDVGVSQDEDGSSGTTFRRIPSPAVERNGSQWNRGSLVIPKRVARPRLSASASETRSPHRATRGNKPPSAICGELRRGKEGARSDDEKTRWRARTALKGIAPLIPDHEKGTDRRDKHRPRDSSTP